MARELDFYEAVDTLGNELEPVELTKHAASSMQMLGDSYTDVRYTAVKTLGKLEAAVRAQPFAG